MLSPSWSRLKAFLPLACLSEFSAFSIAVAVVYVQFFPLSAFLYVCNVTPASRAKSSWDTFGSVSSSLNCRNGVLLLLMTTIKLLTQIVKSNLLGLAYVYLIIHSHLMVVDSLISNYVYLIIRNYFMVVKLVLLSCAYWDLHNWLMVNKLVSHRQSSAIL